MSCSDIIQVVIASVLTAGVLVAVLLPICQECKRRRQRLSRVKRNVSLYLDVLHLKLVKAIADLRNGRKPYSSDSSFEQDNNINYWAIEKQYLDADVLAKGELETLMKFVRSFKTSKNMEEEPEYETFLNQVKDNELRQIFREGKDLQQETRRLLGESMDRS